MALKDNENQPPRRIAVIGAGTAGLAAAYELRQRAPGVEVVVYDPAARVGGKIVTVRRGGYVIEHGPDGFITNKPGTLGFIERIGLKDQLMPTNEAGRQALVVRRGKLVPIPLGFQLLGPSQWWSFLRSPLLSPRGKLRVMCEPFVKARRDAGDESLASFITRRFGRELLDRLVQPLAGGIYTADPAELSMRCTFGRFVELERKHGSVTLGLRRALKKQHAAKASGARYSLFASFRDGMDTLPERLADLIGRECLRLNCAVIAVAPTGDGRWRVTDANGDERVFDALVAACTAPVMGKLLQPVDGSIAQRLAGIPHSSSAVATLCYRVDQFARPLDAFGFVVPAVERRPIIAGSFTSVKYAHRAPAGRVLIRVFLGGALDESMLANDDDGLIDIAQRELAELMGASGEPEVALVTRWASAMPQYTVGHAERVAVLRGALGALPPLELVGIAYDGVGIPDTINSGLAAADRLLRG